MNRPAVGFADPEGVARISFRPRERHAPPLMRAACLINHYQYGDFVGEAIDSVAAQTRPLDEIIVVDDGSSPDHVARLREAVQRHAGVRLIEKENGGQLSCFAAGVAASTADVLFFLDADDTWQPGYVERVMALLEERPEVDFVATAERRVFEDGRVEPRPTPSRDLGISLARSLANGGRWLGQPTSCLAIRRWVLDRIFPLPDAFGWRTCADEALVHGTGLTGARKYVLGEPLVDYRVHGANAWFGRPYDAADRLRRGTEVLRLVEVLRTRQHLPRSLAHLAHHEFRTIPEPSRHDYKDYLRLVSGSDLPGHRKRRIRFALFGWYRLRKRL